MGVQLPSEPITRKEQYLAKAAGQAVEVPAEPITREEAYLEAIANAGGGGGGTSDYPQLTNKPQINGNTLVGNKTASQLGLVAAEAGKGLSTNDYTDADRAIVGGVTAALADKADKSAVKNEFIGTTAEWNALTTAQKKAYDTYQITDDYTEGSGGLPDYSTTEQKTGQKWIDGKDIYFKTVEINVPSDVSTGIRSFPVSTPNISAVKKVEILSSINITGYVPWYNNASVMFSEATETTLDLYFGGNQYAGKKINVTVYYTKTE